MSLEEGKIDATCAFKLEVHELFFLAASLAHQNVIPYGSRAEWAASTTLNKGMKHHKSKAGKAFIIIIIINHMFIKVPKERQNYIITNQMELRSSIPLTLQFPLISHSHSDLPLSCYFFKSAPSKKQVTRHVLGPGRIQNVPAGGGASLWRKNTSVMTLCV